MKNIRAQLFAAGVLKSSDVSEMANATILRAKRSHAPRMENDVSRARAKRALAILEATIVREADKLPG